MVVLQRLGDPTNLTRLRPHLDFLANIDPSPGEFFKTKGKVLQFFQGSLSNRLTVPAC